MKNNKRDYYDVLGINKSATEDEIKKAYKKMALKYHPDRNKEADAEAKFKEINEAYSVLSDKDKKEKYDRFGFSGLDDNNIPADLMIFLVQYLVWVIVLVCLMISLLVEV